MSRRGSALVHRLLETVSYVQTGGGHRSCSAGHGTPAHAVVVWDRERLVTSGRAFTVNSAA